MLGAKKHIKYVTENNLFILFNKKIYQMFTGIICTWLKIRVCKNNKERKKKQDE